MANAAFDLNAVKSVEVEISVLIGKTNIPIHQLLKMGRGAVIELDAFHDDPVWILANDEPIARGEIVLQGDVIAVEVKEAFKDL